MAANGHVTTFIIIDSNESFICYHCCQNAWPRGYKTFSMLNSAEHEIYPIDNY